jgi:hypothetical protein
MALAEHSRQGEARETIWHIYPGFSASLHHLEVSKKQNTLTQMHSYIYVVFLVSEVMCNTAVWEIQTPKKEWPTYCWFLVPTFKHLTHCKMPVILQNVCIHECPASNGYSYKSSRAPAERKQNISLRSKQQTQASRAPSLITHRCMHAQTPRHETITRQLTQSKSRTDHDLP